MLCYCQSCRKERRHNLFLDVTTNSQLYVQVLASCSECNKGRWVEISTEQYKKLKEEYDKKK